MLKYIIFLSIILFFASACNDRKQYVLPNNIEVSNQEELDNLKDALLQVNIFDGDIIIGGGNQSSIEIPIYDLSSLENIVEIKGDLIIANSQLLNINDFESLVKVNGKLVINSETIESIEFPKLVEVEEVIITFCADLKNIILEEVSLVQGRIQISENPKLETISGFNKIENCNFLILSNNLNLSFIDGFADLKFVQNDFVFEVDSLHLSSLSFKNVEQVNHLQCSVNTLNGLKFDWAENLITTTSIFLRGNLGLSGLCPFKNAVIHNPNSFIFNSFQDGLIYYDNDLLMICN